MTDPTSSRGMTRRTIVITITLSAAAWFVLGWSIARALGMHGVDCVTFLLCQGIVFVIGASLAAAWLEPDDSTSDSDQKNDSTMS